jgi:hypothetical protein
MFRKTSKFIPFAGLFLAALIGFPAEATNFTVSNLNDSGSGSLREAIDAANGTVGVDTITFTVSGTIVLGSTLPNITDADGLTIDGTGQSIIVSGNKAVRVMRVDAEAMLNLQNLTVADGNSHEDRDGGGILNIGTLTVRHSTISGNNAQFGDGGGIFNSGTLTVSDSTVSGNGIYPGGTLGAGIFNTGILTVTNSSVSGNSTSVGGGGIFNTGTVTVTGCTFSGNDSGRGGGIANDGALTVTGSTFSDNFSDSLGGGISSSGTVTVTNSTFSGNTTYQGGGIYNGGTLTITNSTISDNRGNYGGSGIYNDGALNLANTILANNVLGAGGDCFNYGSTNINASGINLVADGSCGASSDPAHFITGDPMLSPLTDNGGPTLTHALRAGSPAIDAADDAICADPLRGNNLDQRGVTRPQGPHCDIGAYEFKPPVDACTTPDVLDNFNRHDGSLGHHWRDQTGTRFYRIHNNQVDVRLGGPAFWNPERFGTNQAAFVTLSRVDTRSPAQGTLLKVQDGRGPHTGRHEHEDGKQYENDVPLGGAIAVVYDGQAQAVQVSTIRPGKRVWQLYDKTNLAFSDGDKLGGCALANGDVRVYKNDVLVTTVILDRADQTFFKDKRGKVGLWSHIAPKAVLDNFGGGTIKP